MTVSSRLPTSITISLPPSQSSGTTAFTTLSPALVGDGSGGGSSTIMTSPGVTPSGTITAISHPSGPATKISLPEGQPAGTTTSHSILGTKYLQVQSNNSARVEDLACEANNARFIPTVTCNATLVRCQEKIAPRTQMHEYYERGLCKCTAMLQRNHRAGQVAAASECFVGGTDDTPRV